MRRLALLVGTVVTVAWASPASAQLRSFGVGLSGGLTVPSGDLSNSVNSGYTIGAHFYLLPARFANLRFRADGTYDRFALKEDEGSVRYLGLAFNAMYELPVGSAIRPYVLLGLGTYGLKVSREFPQGRIESTDRDFGLQAGGGLAFELSGFSTFVEARYVNIMRDPSTTYLPIAFGIRF